MKAIQFEKYGDPSVLKINEIHKPILKPRQILVRIKAFGVNPIDWKLRRGDMKSFILLDLPFTLGYEFSGVVEETSYGVSNFKLGDRVYGRAQQTYAEFVAVDAENVQPIPSHLDFVQAASLPSGSQVAYSALVTLGHLQPNQKVLIHAGAGGVGVEAIQIAKSLGAHVTTTVSAKNFELVKALGADEIIDYRQTDLRKLSEKYDLILDSIGGQTQVDSWSLLKENGTLVSLVSDERNSFEKHAPTQNFFFMRSVQGNSAEAINTLVKDQKIQPVIDHIFNFEDIAQAHTRSETGHVSGKIVVNV